MRWVQSMRNLLRRPWQDQCLVGQAYLLLGLARLAINTVPFSRLATRLGAQQEESSAAVPPHHIEQARRTGWAVSAASRYTPWNSNCLPQAITAKYLLHRRGIDSTLYLGTAFRARTQLEAHAWLRCGSIYVTGGAARQRFEPLGVFGPRVKCAGGPGSREELR